MAEEKKETTTAAIHSIPKQPADSTITFRVPKPNMQVAVLGLIALITLFQTVQLVRISANTNTASVVKTAPAVLAPAATGTNAAGSGSNASTPQSMVGGC